MTRSAGWPTAVVLALAACAPRAVPAQGTPSGTPPGTEALGWLAGCWERASGASVVEEAWLPPRGGTLIGVSRTVRDGVAVAYEHLLVLEVEGGVVYRASPSGQATTDFTATHLSDTAAVFENPAHDFPTRVAYRRAAGDSLHARVEGPGRDGAVRRVDFRFGRGRCPG